MDVEQHPMHCDFSQLSPRERMIRATCRLFEAQGYHATGLSEILQASDAPRGSLYYYFPNGKEELAVEAIEWQGQAIYHYIRNRLASNADAAEAVKNLFFEQANHAEVTGYQSIGPLTVVALESPSNDRLREACARVYEDWRAAFTEKLMASGFAPEQACTLSLTILTMLEGAVTLTRTLRQAEPLRQAGEQVSQLLKLAQASNL